jgi:hypothetical protein
VCGGIEMAAPEIITLGPGERAHLRTAGSSSWVVIQIPDQDLVRYGRAVSGPRFCCSPLRALAAARYSREAVAPVASLGYPHRRGALGNPRR